MYPIHRWLLNFTMASADLQVLPLGSHPPAYQLDGFQIIQLYPMDLHDPRWPRTDQLLNVAKIPILPKSWSIWLSSPCFLHIPSNITKSIHIYIYDGIPYHRWLQADLQVLPFGSHKSARVSFPMDLHVTPGGPGSSWSIAQYFSKIRVYIYSMSLPKFHPTNFRSIPSATSIPTVFFMVNSHLTSLNLSFIYYMWYI